MTCRHCCDANEFFDTKAAKKELRKYVRNGAKGPTRHINDFVNGLIAEDDSLLDIGGGIGAIQWNFFENGGTSTTDVDASQGYVETAKDYAATIGQLENASFHVGDFVDVSEKLEVHDFVTMDKVICCYPDFKRLLGQATAKTGKAMVLSFPRSGFLFRILSQIAALYFKWKKSAFRSYVHPVDQIQQFIEDQGFELKHTTGSFPWIIHVYQRRTVAH